MTREQVLDTAKQTVCEIKGYGKPENNFGVIAEYWSAYTDTVITPEDVAAMMILLKVARVQTGTAKDDNWVDIAGYAACGGEIQDALNKDDEFF